MISFGIFLPQMVIFELENYLQLTMANLEWIIAWFLPIKLNKIPRVSEQPFKLQTWFVQ